LDALIACIKHLKTNNMNLLEQTPEEYKQEVEKLKTKSDYLLIAFYVCLAIILFLFFVVFCLEQSRDELKEKIKHNMEAIDSYKNLTPKNQ